MTTELPLFQIDAFTDRVFGGNPAAVMLLEQWMPDDELARLAVENNLPATAFLVSADPPSEAVAGDVAFALRWFTPTAELDLCGHATLASGWLVLERLLPDVTAVWFSTRSGWLSVRRSEEGRMAMDFPSNMPERVDIPEDSVAVVGVVPVAAWATVDLLLLVVDHQSEVRGLSPDPALMKQWPRRGVIVTAPADDSSADFVSRVFYPGAGIGEDHVTGSAHTILGPYWAARLNNHQLRARQISARGGDLWLSVAGDRVVIEGKCTDYLTGTVTLP